MTTPVRRTEKANNNNTTRILPTLFRCSLLRRVALLGLIALLSGVQHTWGQSVIMSDDSYYLKHNDEGSSLDGTATTGFTPSKCIWYINSNTVRTANANGEAFDGNNYLQTGGASLGSSATWVQAQNGSNLIATNGNYLRRRNSNSAWTIDGTNNHRATAYAVTTSSVIGTFSVSGDATITVTGTNSSYSHTNANYYDIYTFNGLTYYSTDPSADASTTAPTSSLPTLTSGYTWSISSNSYATINSSTGAITVNSLPANDTNITLTCSITRNGVTKTANKTITLEAPKVDPTGISITSANSLTINVGGTSTITYSLTPSPCYDNVTYSSGNDGVATVNSSGIITGVAAGTTTITVSAHKIGGATTSELTKTVNVTVKDKVATPVITFTPDEKNITTATASIECSTPGTPIYYTTNGNNPTNGDQTYNGPFTVNENQVIKAIAVKTSDATYWDDSDVASVTYVSCTTAAPIISYMQSGGIATVTITAEDGATIYYTTNGNDPTTSSSSSSNTVTLNNVSSGTTVKAFAKNGTCQASGIVTKEIITSGASGGVVTLYDYEDHNWTYYSGVDASVDGGNYNTNYLGKLYSPNPRNVKITYKANGGAVSISESETEFVYYKTLEQGTTAGQYPYTVISNPFSKRPNGKGFGGWRIKEGAQYINGYNDEDVLPLDADIVFTNLPYPNVNSTSAEIEFEATWVNYNNRTYASGNTFTYSVTGGTYETNFLVLNRNVTGTITVSSPCTIMMVEPDGSTDYRGTYTFTGAITPGANIVTKIEFAHWQPGAAVDARGCNFTIGRGMTMDGTRRALYGTGQTSAMNQVLKVESGNFSTFTSYTANASPVTKHWVFFGCDYDRAKGDNAKLTFSGAFTTGASRTLSLASTAEMARVYSLSGSFMTGISIDDAAAGKSYYIGITNNHNNGHRYLEIQGGEWYANIAGGMGENHTPSVPAFTFRMRGGIIRGSVYGAAAYAGAGGTRTYVITGGTIGGWVAGGANGTQSNGGQLKGATYIYVGGKARVDSKGSTSVINRAVGGNVFGAGCGYGTSSNSGEITLGTNVVVADEAYIERGVYGGGSYGFCNTGQTSNIYITGGTVDGKSGGVSGTTYQASITGGVFGGACQNKGGTVNITMTGGQVNGGIYGGSNATGTISGSVTLNINGGQVGTSSATANIHGGGFGQPTRVSQNVDITLGASGQTEAGVTVYGDVYGGSALGYVNGTAATNTYHTNVTMNKGIINGSLYGGGLGNAGNAANVYGPVTVTVNGGTVNTTSANGSGAVYGCNNINGAPQRAVAVIINGTDPAPDENTYALDAVYGGGNQADYTYATPTVTVNNCDNSIAYVYGGGNAASVPATDVQIYGGNKIGNVFAGGNGTNGAADVDGDTRVRIYGGTIGRVFGGSNSAGTIDGTISVEINKTGTCAMHIDEVYGGGNEADSNVGSISIGCTGNKGEGIGDLYGGANQANITGDISLNITGGSIGRVFGGNNTSGNIDGDIEVKVNWKTGNDKCGYDSLGSVFGGGNLAPYTGDPVVNILNGTVSGNVYGGGAGELVDGTDRGQAGKVTGNPQITIGDNDDSHKAIIKGEVYGGGDAADVDGTPKIVVYDCNTMIGDLYGGGNAADVDSTNITIYGGTINMAFGGGHGDKDASSPSKYADVKGNVTFNIYGGTFNKVFAGSNSKGDITGISKLNINKTGTCQMKIGEVYGGGNEAAGNAGTVTIGCTGSIVTGEEGHAAHPENIGTTLEGIGTVYGGANAADIGKSGTPSNITLNINSGMVNNVFGGNNTSGDIYGTIAVNINKNAETCGWYVGNVFGGGNLAAYTGATTVTVTNGEVSHNVYGGGNEAGVGSATVNINGGSVLDGVYGGCNTEGTVGGKIAVNLNGGTVGSDTKHADVYGGGLGSATATSGGIDVTLNGTTVYGDLYGGSALGSVNADDADTTTITISSNTLHGTIYGGGKGDVAGEEGHSNVTATSNGNVLVNYNTANIYLTGLYGGANINGLIKGDITVNVLANVGATGAGKSVNVFGGGLGHNTNTNGNVTVNVGDGSNSPVIYGDVYGGSALGNVNNGTDDYTYVNLNKGTIHGDAYGGGLGDAGNAALVNGNVTVTQNGVAFVSATTTDDASHTIVTAGRIFGCNNLNGSPKGTVLVLITQTAPVSGSTYDMAAVYGGGNLAAYNPASANATGQYTTGHTATNKPVQVVIDGCDNVSIEYVYGGGNAAATPATDVVILGAKEIGYAFGGGNGKDKYTLDGGTTWTANPGADVGIINGSNYGTGESLVTLTGGTIHYAFGGSNTLGNVRKSATVFLDETNLVCPLRIDEVYGGGNEAYMSGDAQIELGCISYLKEIYGGAKEADLGGNIVLTITSGRFDRVFGGNNLGGCINGSITVNIEETGCHPVVIGQLYGGGNKAGYSVFGYDSNHKPKENGTREYDDPQVNVKSFTSIGDIFGGGLGVTAILVGNTNVNINEVLGANSNDTVTAGSYTYDIDTNDTTGHFDTDGNFKGWSVEFYDDADDPSKVTTITVPIHEKGQIGAINRVFGGGNAAKVIGNTYLNIGTDETVTYVSGDKSTKNVEGVDIRDNVYGGGNKADVTGTSKIKVGQDSDGGTSGGGNGAPIRSEQPADQPADQPQQPAQPQDPANGNTNGATESQQSRNVTPTRL